MIQGLVVKELKEALDRVGASVSALATAIEPILVMEPPANTLAQQPGTSPASSPLAQQLVILERMAAEIDLRLVDLAKRVDL